MRRLLLFFGIRLLFAGTLSLALQSQTYVLPLHPDCRIFEQPGIYGNPVCGSDGATYTNNLLLDCLNYHTTNDVIAVHHGHCLVGEQYCRLNPPYNPVCGSDGNTYKNLETLLCDNYKHSRDVRVVASGMCQKYDSCEIYTNEFYGANLVCGNDGVTYQNLAYVRCLQQYNPNLRVVHYGPCKTIAKDPCTYVEELGPLKNLEYADGSFSIGHVCGSDGYIYRSIHHLQCAAMLDKYLYLRHPGPCFELEDSPCLLKEESRRIVPVCGSDGTTYSSPEALWCANERTPVAKVRYVHDGRC